MGRDDIAGTGSGRTGWAARASNTEVLGVNDALLHGFAEARSARLGAARAHVPRHTEPPGGL